MQKITEIKYSVIELKNPKANQCGHRFTAEISRNVELYRRSDIDNAQPSQFVKLYELIFAALGHRRMGRFPAIISRNVRENFFVSSTYVFAAVLCKGG